MKSEVYFGHTSTDKQLDELYDAMDALMREGCFGFINDYIRDLIPKIWRTDLIILVGYATATLCCKSKLPARKAFMDKCMELYPDKELWKGLE